MLDWRQFIEVNPSVLQGKPVVKGTRIPVSLILSYLAGGMGVDEILAEYPTLTKEAIYACLAYASELVDLEEVVEVGAYSG
ncbi:Uncharacterized conserved protein, DUF433 family [Candidatus Fervidibacteria bacterium JGI MDM2 JNZ-1-D12]